ncbi:MAG: phospholipase D-like domain-containing protein [Coleofasciculus sp. B1-GNL1-01]|uniref:phospholipase D-like domain-containing protein n=1 Tax=Coleofasciculus sp. B1-GNL1-01 TaxID=3068484 RepID=UPI0032F364E0
MNVPKYDFLICPEQCDQEQIARRYDNRAGFDLVSYKEVGLPVYKITVQALTQIRKPIPPIEEYVLKAIHAGLSSEQDIAGFLGLEPSILREAMIELRLSETIDLIAPEDSAMQVWKLTKKGERTLKEAQLIVPEERSFTINFDGLLRYVRWYGRLDINLLRPRELRQQGMMEIPALPAKPPELSDIKLTDVDRIISQDEKERKKTRSRERELLALKTIERRQRFFQPALALIYKAKDRDEVQVAFAIDERLSSEHEQAFARANGVKKLRIIENLNDSECKKLAEDILGREFVAQAPLPEVDDIKDKVASVRATIETTRQTIERTQTDHEKKELEQKLQAANQEIEKLQAQLNDVPIRWLGVYEHRPLLKQALQDSQERLLIISPWIRANATNELIQQLEKLLKRGVKVFIGYGLGEDYNQKTRDKKAENAIEKLDQQYDNFRLKRLGDTHAKILISDSKFAVVTSFNWLSFKGDPNRTFRDERGTLVFDSQKIKELFDKEMKRFSV